MADDSLDRVFAAWAMAELLDDHEPATEQEIALAEAALGHPLPAQLRRLYSETRGDALGIELVIQPILPGPPESGPFALTTTSGLMREWHWPVPEPLLLFADSGGEQHFGLWLDPEDQTREPLVVEVESTDDPACLAIIAQDLGAFLLERTFREFSYEDDLGGARWALDPLDAPSDLVGYDPEQADQARDEYVWRWANPNLPEQPRDRYGNLLTPEQVQAVSREVARARGAR